MRTVSVCADSCPRIASERHPWQRRQRRPREPGWTGPQAGDPTEAIGPPRLRRVTFEDSVSGCPSHTTSLPLNRRYGGGAVGGIHGHAANGPS